jgi:hypothetical protein
MDVRAVLKLIFNKYNVREYWIDWFMREASDRAFVSTEMNHGVHKRLEEVF